MGSPNHDAAWKRYDRAIRILQGEANGHALPILWSLASRQFAPAVNAISDYASDRQSLAILRRAARRGDPVSAYNLAITYRNRGDMTGYRLALARAARLDATGESASELRQFRTRFPEPVMRRYGRLASSRVVSRLNRRIGGSRSITSNDNDCKYHDAYQTSCHLRPIKAWIFGAINR
jgi:hypothetical protein